MFVFLFQFVQFVPLSLFFRGGGENSVKIKLFKKFMMKDTIRCPEDYQFLALKKLVFPFFEVGGGGVKMLRCLSLLSPTP